MLIIGFIVIFTIIGFIIGVVIKDDNTAMGVIIIMSILWLFAMGPWAIATLIELSLGFAIAKNMK